MDRAHLQERFTEIEATLSLWWAEAEDKRDFWSAFADEANEIARHTEPADKDFVRDQLDRMLRSLDLLATARAVTECGNELGLDGNGHGELTPS